MQKGEFEYIEGFEIVRYDEMLEMVELMCLIFLFCFRSTSLYTLLRALSLPLPGDFIIVV
jgi:hypothetical protein